MGSELEKFFPANWSQLCIKPLTNTSMYLSQLCALRKIMWRLVVNMWTSASLPSLCFSLELSRNLRKLKASENGQSVLYTCIAQSWLRNSRDGIQSLLSKHTDLRDKLLIHAGPNRSIHLPGILVHFRATQCPWKLSNLIEKLGYFEWTDQAFHYSCSWLGCWCKSSQLLEMTIS